MIDLAKILEKIDARISELGTTAATISAKATDSKDTIRNWARAVEADRLNRTNKASATTIKINQIEEALGIELATNSTDSTFRSEAEIKAMLRRIDNLPESAINPVFGLISGFLRDAAQSTQTPAHNRSESATHHRTTEPSK